MQGAGRNFLILCQFGIDPMTKQDIINEIRRYASENGVPPGIKLFSKQNGLRPDEIVGKYWVRWSDAIREAGYEPQQWNSELDRQSLVIQYIALIRELGHFPIKAELQLKHRNDKSFPTTHTLLRHLGSKPETAKAILFYCREHVGFEDVVPICEAVSKDAESVEQKDESGPKEVVKLGFVYLFKSGKFYKIGRSNSSGRREYELSIQLPHKLTKVHEIKTDDPIGIEAYWHKRFELKHKNGEWFDLNLEDIQAFKRRKFM